MPPPLTEKFGSGGRQGLAVGDVDTERRAAFTVDERDVTAMGTDQFGRYGKAEAAPAFARSTLDSLE